MQVILTKEVPDLGHAGELVTVKPGYGSNYLIPNGLAILATVGNKRRLEHEQRRIEAQIARERAESQSLADKLSGLSVTLTRIVATDEKDKIFGSVTTKDIADALANEGYQIDRRAIELEAPLKALGVYEIPVRLHRDVVATVKVWVVAD